MSNSDTGEVENVEDNIRYDLAGNPLPSLPPAARPDVPPPSVIPTQQFGGSTGAPGFTPPPGSSLGWGGGGDPRAEDVERRVCSVCGIGHRGNYYYWPDFRPASGEAELRQCPNFLHDLYLPRQHILL